MPVSKENLIALNDNLHHLYRLMGDYPSIEEEQLYRSLFALEEALRKKHDRFESRLESISRSRPYVRNVVTQNYNHLKHEIDLTNAFLEGLTPYYDLEDDSELSLKGRLANATQALEDFKTTIGYYQQRLSNKQKLRTAQMTVSVLGAIATGIAVGIAVGSIGAGFGLFALGLLVGLGIYKLNDMLDPIAEDKQIVKQEANIVQKTQEIFSNRSSSGSTSGDPDSVGNIDEPIYDLFSDPNFVT